MVIAVMVAGTVMRGSSLATAHTACPGEVATGSPTKDMRR
jgi:hypothetical protein